jgi:Papain-like cysteine protease AvrRpt2
MGIESGSALWAAQHRIAELIDPQRLTGEWSWDRLDLHVPHQQEDNWCWAATSDGIAHFYDHSSTWTQCAIANSALGLADCCGKGASGACNVYGYLDQALSIVGGFNRENAAVAEFYTVHYQIRAHRPLGVRIAWSGGGAHFVAIGGFRERPSRYVHVEDPWYGPSDVAYATLVSSYQGTGSWTNTYWTKP